MNKDMAKGKTSAPQGGQIRVDIPQARERDLKQQKKNDTSCERERWPD